MPSIKVFMSKIKTMRGRVTGYRANLADVSADGATPTEAQTNLQVAVTTACTYQSPHVEKIGRYIIIIVPTIHGFESRLIGPDDKDGKQLGCCQSGPGSLESLRQSVLTSICQFNWKAPEANPEYELAKSLLSHQMQLELHSWEKWQWRYQEARDSGLDENSARDLANLR